MNASIGMLRLEWSNNFLFALVRHVRHRSHVLNLLQNLEVSAIGTLTLVLLFGDLKLASSKSRVQTHLAVGLPVRRIVNPGRHPAKWCDHRVTNWPWWQSVVWYFQANLKCTLHHGYIIIIELLTKRQCQCCPGILWALSDRTRERSNWRTSFESPCHSDIDLTVPHLPRL